MQRQREMAVSLVVKMSVYSGLLAINTVDERLLEKKENIVSSTTSNRSGQISCNPQWERSNAEIASSSEHVSCKLILISSVAGVTLSAAAAARRSVVRGRPAASTSGVTARAEDNEGTR